MPLAYRLLLGSLATMSALGLTVVAFIILPRWPSDYEFSPDIVCEAPQVVDGDTIRCSGERIRLLNIDAPELPGHCIPGRHCVPGDPYASADNLKRLIAKGDISCLGDERDRYGRMLARCSVEGVDLSCAQVRGGFAVERYGKLDC